MKKLTQKQLREQALKRFLKRWRSQPIKINIATQSPAWPSFEPIGYVTDLRTNQPFYFEGVCTVPKNPAHIDTQIYSYPIKVYDHEAVLAPYWQFEGRTEYLHPAYISAKDYRMLQELYRQQVREWEFYERG